MKLQIRLTEKNLEEELSKNLKILLIEKNLEEELSKNLKRLSKNVILKILNEFFLFELRSHELSLFDFYGNFKNLCQRKVYFIFKNFSNRFMESICSSEPIYLENKVIKECLPQTFNYFDYYPFRFDKSIKQKNIRLIELSPYRKTQFNLRDKITHFTYCNFDKRSLEEYNLIKSSRKIIINKGCEVLKHHNEYFIKEFRFNLFQKCEHLPVQVVKYQSEIYKLLFENKKIINFTFY